MLRRNPRFPASWPASLPFHMNEHTERVRELLNLSEKIPFQCQDLASGRFPQPEEISTS